MEGQDGQLGQGLGQDRQWRPPLPAVDLPTHMRQLAVEGMSPRDDDRRDLLDRPVC